MKLTRYERDAVIVLIVSFMIPFIAGVLGSTLGSYDTAAGAFLLIALGFLVYRGIRRAVGLGREQLAKEA